MGKTVELAIKSGAKTINISNIVCHIVTSEFKKIIETLLNKVPNIDKAILSTHCHNDLGLAVANSLAGVMAGARQIECIWPGAGQPGARGSRGALRGRRGMCECVRTCTCAEFSYNFRFFT